MKTKKSRILTFLGIIVLSPLFLLLESNTESKLTILFSTFYQHSTPWEDGPGNGNGNVTNLHGATIGGADHSITTTTVVPTNSTYGPVSANYTSSFGFSNPFFIGESDHDGITFATSDAGDGKIILTYHELGYVSCPSNQNSQGKFDGSRTFCVYFKVPEKATYAITLSGSTSGSMGGNEDPEFHEHFVAAISSDTVSSSKDDYYNAIKVPTASYSIDDNNSNINYTFKDIILERGLHKISFNTANYLAKTSTPGGQATNQFHFNATLNIAFVKK